MSTPSPARTRRKRWIVLSAVIALVLLVAAAAWVGSRVLSARDSLESAATTAASMPTLIRAQDTAGVATAAQSFAADAAASSDATGDPLWRMMELVPWLGGNLTAVREISGIADDLATEAVVPLADIASQLDPTALGFSDGRMDVAPLVAAAPVLDRANAAFQNAAGRARNIQTPSIPLVSDALDELRQATNTAAASVDALDRAAALLPTMLGTEEPRTYLLLMLNNAELRTQGGIPGAVATLQAEAGRISIVEQRAASDIMRPREPVIDLSASTIALFDTLPGRFMQNTVSALDFSESAEAASALWERTTGVPVDGVIAIDTVSLAYLLEATGPIDAGAFRLDADNAVETLLSTAYSAIGDHEVRDDAFALVASAIFDALTAGAGDPVAVLTALDHAAREHRLHIWSADPTEQERLDGTSLQTILLPDDESTRRIGVFYNDVTSSKLDYYATPKVTVKEICGSDPRIRVTVDWSNTVPPDPVDSLPRYVTGSGLSGTPVGDTLTRVTVAGPAEWTASDYQFDDGRIGVQTAQYQDRTAIQHEFVTTPGGSHRIIVEFRPPAGERPAVVPLEVVTTPTVQQGATAEIFSDSCAT
ncbi:DUF4012 domain-containing protein [Microbacterium sp.]|uniref:DUF4012 domain-containing protein n=1 Tax=Microbacterium sp. TaxID=51671 RepID=UPI0037CBB273